MKDALASAKRGYCPVAMLGECDGCEVPEGCEELEKFVKKQNHKGE